MKNYNLVLLPGDGIGPEIISAATDVMHAAASRYGFTLTAEKKLIGGCALDEFGVPLPDETLEACKASDAVFMGAVGGPKWDAVPGSLRPEKGLLGIRKGLGLYANLRPAIIFPALKEASPLKSSIVKDGLDVLIVRELTGGIYFGERGRCTAPDGTPAAFDTERYSVAEIERISRVAFDAARTRGMKKAVTVVDKANVLESSRLWREVTERVAADYPDVAVNYQYVDNAAMQLVKNPGQFDVMLTSNMFGDILSDEAAEITGSIGMLPSASLGSGTLGLYEPAHGSAPDIAGQDVANPLATILSGAMLLRYSLGENAAADAIETAVGAVLDAGVRTIDLAGGASIPTVGTKEMGRLVTEALR